MIKSIVSFLIVSGLAVAASSISSAQDLWHGAVVGMSLQELQKKFPSAHTYIHHVEARIPYDETNFGWDSQNVDGCSFDIDFNLVGDKLKSVSHTLNTESTNSQYCQRISLEHLTEKYGKPDDVDLHNPRLSSETWNTKSGVRIIMMFSSFPPINRYLAFITYSKKPDSANNNIF